MTVKQLIAKLKKMPQNVEVHFACHDNCTYETQGAVHSVYHLSKNDDHNFTEEEIYQMEDMPDQWVTLRP